VAAGAIRTITGAGEGDIDAAILRRLARHAGFEMAAVYGGFGKPRLLQSLHGYNNAARFSPWLVLVDLDGDGPCAPPCCQAWLPHPAPFMCFRIAVRAAEAWLLADGEAMARLLAVPTARLPRDPDALDNPKRELVNLARGSRRAATRDGLVPREGSGRLVGQLYTSTMIAFIEDEGDGWRPERARVVSDSLARCMRRLENMAGEGA
jgi:hypothetical protein